MEDGEAECVQVFSLHYAYLNRSWENGAAKPTKAILVNQPATSGHPIMSPDVFFLQVYDRVEKHQPK